MALVANLTNFVQFWLMKFLTCFTVSKILLQQHKTMSWCILQNNTIFMKGYVLNFPLRLMITDGKTMRIALLHCMPQYRTSGSSMRLCKTVSRSSLEMEQSPSSENSTTSGKKKKIWWWLNDEVFFTGTLQFFFYPTGCFIYCNIIF